MVARTLTPEMAAAASTLVKIAHAGDTSLSRACDRAQERLMVQPWAIVSGLLEIASLSNPGDIRITDGETCSCPTSKGTCYHVAGWLMLSTLAAAGVAPMSPLPLPIEIDEDELPADSFLDGPFDAFEDASLTGHDEYGDIITAPAPSFVEVDGPVVLVKRRPAPFRLEPSRIIPNPLDADVDAMFAA